MSVIYVLLPVALLIAGVALAMFIWAVRSGQMDDLDTPSRRMLHDDDPVQREEEGRPRKGSGPARP